MIMGIADLSIAAASPIVTDSPAALETQQFEDACRTDVTGSATSGHALKEFGKLDTSAMSSIVCSDVSKADDASLGSSFLDDVPWTVCLRKRKKGTVKLSGIFPSLFDSSTSLFSE